MSQVARAEAVSILGWAGCAVGRANWDFFCVLWAVLICLLGLRRGAVWKFVAGFVLVVLVVLVVFGHAHAQGDKKDLMMSGYDLASQCHQRRTLSFLEGPLTRAAAGCLGGPPQRVSNLHVVLGEVF